MSYYVGNPLQTRGAEKYILQEGKGDCMHFLYIRNGLGLTAWLSLDRAGDISRLEVNGKNIGYFSPCGYVSPKYYDRSTSEGFLRNFTAGFFTTCGLFCLGEACVDDGEQLPMHGNISNIPATLLATEESEDGLTVKLRVTDAVLFGRKLVLDRIYNFSYKENRITLDDKVTNIADKETSFAVMYHCNMGYPLLSENSIVKIPNNGVHFMTKRSEEEKETAFIMEKPQSGYTECCYCYDVTETEGKAKVGIFNPDIKCGMVMTYDKKTLPCFTEWKMMGKYDYVLGLEPGTSIPDSRNILREKGTLEFLSPEQSREMHLEFKFIADEKDFI